MVTALIVFFDEIEKIKLSLESVKSFDEIIVIDISKGGFPKDLENQYKVKVYKHHFVPFVEMIRDFAISKANGEWILILDPDEKMTTELIDKLKEIIKENKYDAVNIPRKNIFFGKWIAHTNWWPDRHIRFFKKGNLKWGEKIHTYPKVEGGILNLDSREDLAIIHYGYESISEFIKRQNRYSDIEAIQLHKEGVRFRFIFLLWWPLREFIVRYIKHAGFLDGFEGFSLTFLMMIYQVMLQVKLWELEKNK